MQSKLQQTKPFDRRVRLFLETIATDASGEYHVWNVVPHACYGPMLYMNLTRSEAWLLQSQARVRRLLEILLQFFCCNSIFRDRI